MITDAANTINYDSIADDLANKGFAVLDHLIPFDQSIELLQILKSRKEEGAFKAATIGKGDEQQRVDTIRNDDIHWLNPTDEEAVIRLWFARVNEIASVMSRLLMLPINDYECHFAHFAKGSFYKKHLDVFRESENRVLSVVAYLNPDWQVGDGGELLIYDGSVRPAHKQPVIETIQPINGRVVLMRSDSVPHEVSEAYKDRYSLTGWLRYNRV